MNSFFSRILLKMHDRFTGRRIFERLEELNRTQWLSRDDILALQRVKLQHLLEYAYQFVPYYRRLFDEVTFNPRQFFNNPTSFHKIPLLTKSIINDHFSELVTTNPQQRQHLSRNSTGGSTGHPLVFIQDDNFRDCVTADIHRHIEWTGWKVGEPHAYIWGTDYEVSSQRAIRTRLMDWCLNRFVVNAFALSDVSMMDFTRKVQRKKPIVLYGYASALTRYAEFVKAHHLENLKFLSVISSAEMLYPYQREMIERTFKCKVLNKYATRELGSIACECKEQKGLHISVENVYLEVLHDLYPAPINQDGDIVVTNLNNYGMPFIRYSVGDVGQLGEGECSCGRGLPIMQMVYGRSSDLFKTKEGRTIHGEFFTHLFYGTNQVQQFQVIQKSYENILVSIVAKSPLSTEKLAFLEYAIKDIMQSNVKVEFKFSDFIPVLPSGKYRFTISEVN